MKRIVAIFCVVFPVAAQAQDDLLKELEQSQKPEVEYIEQTFKGTRLVNGQSVESKGKGELEFIFAHRFGPVNSGLYEMFGLDQAYVRLGLEYGLTDKLGVGIGRNSFDKTMDAFLRYKVLRQSKGARNMPVTVTAFANTALKTYRRSEDKNFSDQLSYTAQLLIARKFTPNLSLQLMPTMVHKNAVFQDKENNDQFALGAGGRIKVSRSVALTSEYYYRFNVPSANEYHNVLGLGIDIETGGHIFQLVLTNTRGLTERAWLTETTGEIKKGDIHLGFNVTRTFQLVKRK